ALCRARRSCDRHYGCPSQFNTPKGKHIAFTSLEKYRFAQLTINRSLSEAEANDVTALCGCLMPRNIFKSGA
ncbi:MAG: hypothetical protein ACK5UZ_10855, partial [Pseudanabaena sp.]